MLLNRQSGCPPRPNMQMAGAMPGQMCQPIIEPAMTDCIVKEFYHEVPQYCF